MFGRPRPAFAVYHEGSAAFPSGHSAASVIVFGFLTYVVIRERIGTRLVAGVTGLPCIVIVGLSRLYLLEHYLSDVLSGYLVGAVWLVLAICVSELSRAKVDLGEIRQARPWRRTAFFAVVVCTGIAVWFAAEIFQRGLIVTDPFMSRAPRTSTP